MPQETPRQDARAPAGSRVLAVRGGALGDFILTLPSLRALRGAGYAVELLTRPAYGRLAQEAGIVSGWRPLDAPEAACLTLPGAVIEPAWRKWLSGFGAVVSWLPDGDGAFQSQLLEGGIRRFYQGDWRCPGPGPAAMQLAEAIAFCGTAAAPVADLFGEWVPGAPPAGQVIALHAGSGSPRKNWPLECWLDVMTALQARHPGVSWLVISGEAEEERFPEIAAVLNRSGLPWEAARGWDLTALARRLRPCRMLLGHDSGISHLAAACGVPCRLLFGPTDPAVWAPMGNHVRVLTAPGGSLDELPASAVLDWMTAGLSL